MRLKKGSHCTSLPWIQVLTFNEHACCYFNLLAGNAMVGIQGASFEDEGAFSADIQFETNCINVVYE